MNNRKQQYELTGVGSSMATSQGRPIRFDPNQLLSPVGHATLTGGAAGSVTVLLELLAVVLLQEWGHLALNLTVVLVMILLACLVTAACFYLAYRFRDEEIRQLLYKAEVRLDRDLDGDGVTGPPPPVADEPPPDPITDATARRPDGTIGRIKFPADLGMTEDKLYRLAMGIVENRLSWSRRGLAAIIPFEVYPKFCQVMLDQHFIRTEGKGYSVTEHGRKWFAALIREAHNLPYRDGENNVE